MSLDPKLLEILVCPVCKSSLNYAEQRSVLSCSSCSRRFPVIGGIPDLIP